MKNPPTQIKKSSLRLLTMALVTTMLFVGLSFSSDVVLKRLPVSYVASANHPVLLEGNCDSPVPGTTLVSPGTCGDFDGDGRIGTAEDTDGADRIFGTLKAALGPGTGAAAGTGANQNGTILIVKSGRFAESVLIGYPLPAFPGEGNVNAGNVTIEAAPGVEANIDAVLQGDPAGGNTSRQNSTGLTVYFPDSNYTTRVVTLRNLSIRNWTQGVGIGGVGTVVIDNCRVENNLEVGVRFFSSGSLMVVKSQLNSNGRRIGGPISVPIAGDGLWFQGTGNVRVFDASISNNIGAGIRNDSGSAPKLKLYKVATFLNGTDVIGPFTISTDPNYSN